MLFESSFSCDLAECPLFIAVKKSFINLENFFSLVKDKNAALFQT